MVQRMGAVRGVCLSAAAAVVATGLGVVTTPAAHAVDPTFPAPDSASWLPLEHAGTVLTDAAGEVDPAVPHLDLTAAGGANGTAAGFASADLRFAYFRFHVAGVPAAGAAGGYVVQFDTDGNNNGWERALRYEPASGTVGVYQGDNSAPNAKSAPVATIAIPAANQLKTASADGGAWVAFAIARGKLTDSGINLGAPMVMGATSETIDAVGAGLNGNSFLGLGKAKADILGVGKSSPSWTSIASDPLTIDSDGDGIADNVDNCPVDANPGQEDDDAALDGTLPDNPANNVPDGTEGMGNACDPTPRGYNWDGDQVGYLDDNCPEQYGLDPNGCVAQSITTAILRYKAAKHRFSGLVSSDYDQCNPRRNVTIYRQVKGPDPFIGKVKSGTDARFALKLAKKPKAGTYYAYVDPKWTLGARCFGVRAPKIKVG